MNMEYRIKLKDLREHDGLYYIGDIVDVDGSPWVSKEFALQTIDMINAEVNQPAIDRFGDSLFYDSEYDDEF